MSANPKHLTPELQRKQQGFLPITIVTLLAVILVEISVGVAVFFIVIYSGAYSVAATEPHYESTVWVLSTIMDNSVRHHASGIVVSETFKSPVLAVGYGHYNEMCVPSLRKHQNTCIMSPCNTGWNRRKYDAHSILSSKPFEYYEGVINESCV